MKFDNELRLARLASSDVLHGGASALTLAKRMEAITGSSEGVEIVTRVYTRPDGKGTFECRECGQLYLSAYEANGCCMED